MNQGTWILVADACRARVFVDHGLRSGLEEVQGYVHPGGRDHVHDRVSARSGLKPAGANGVRAGASQEVDPKEAQARVFARYLADNLKRKLQEQAFHDLVLAAPPHFLGLLRAALEDSVAERVVCSYPKDYLALGPEALSSRIHVFVR